MIYAVDGGLNQLLMKLALQFFVNSLMENLLVLVKKKKLETRDIDTAKLFKILFISYNLYTNYLMKTNLLWNNDVTEAVAF